MISAYWLEILTMAGIMSIAALGLYAIKATGQLSAGHAAFMGLGGYASGVVTGKLGLPFILSFVAAVALVLVVATAFAYMTSRLRFFYQAVGTLAFGETLVLVMYNVPYFGGASGLQPIPLQTTFTLVYAVLAASIYFFVRFEHSRLGQAFRCVWEDDTVAASMGIDVTKTRILSFTMGATFAALAGVLYAHFLGIMEPKDLDFLRSLTILIFVAFGGLETHWGALFGTYVLTLLPEVARFSVYDRYTIYGALIVVTMVFRPKGLLTRKPLGAPDGPIARFGMPVLRGLAAVLPVGRRAAKAKTHAERP